MNYLDIKKETIVYARMLNHAGKYEVREARFVELKYYSETDKFRGVINLAGIGDISMDAIPTVLYPTVQDAINETNEIVVHNKEMIGAILHRKNDDISRRGTIIVWHWDGTKAVPIEREFTYDVLVDDFIPTLHQGDYETKEGCEENNTLNIYKFSEEEGQKYVVNVFHEYVERIEVTATNAQDAKSKAENIATKTATDFEKLYWLEITDSEINSVNGVPTYGMDEPPQE